MARSKILFLDWRDVVCGRLQWLNEDGETFGVANPPEPPIPLHSESFQVPYGIRLVAQPAEKTGPVDGWKGWGRIIYEDGKYRSWHFEVNGHTKLGTGAAAHRTPYDEVYICGVVSDDGYDWREASRSRIEPGSQRGFDGVSFFIDPVAPERERYKMVYCATFPEGEHDDLMRDYLKRSHPLRDSRITWKKRRGMFAAVSPDGETWASNNMPFMIHASDTDTTVFWDRTLEKYVMFTRMFRHNRRWIGRAEAADFREWGPVEPVLGPSLDMPSDRDLYLNGHSFYPGLPDYQLMFPMVYHRLTERSDVHLAVSDDGFSWQWVPGDPVIQTGDLGAWDSEFIGSGKDLLPFGPGRIAIPYSGTPYPHKYPRFEEVWDAWDCGWAVWDEDRLCGLIADDIGEFWTGPHEPAGRSIRLNCRVPTGGEIRVGVEGIDGRGIEAADPIVGADGIVDVTWRGKSGLGTSENEPVTLHFRLRRAELFSVEFV